MRGLDDLGEDETIVTAEIAGRAGAPEKSRQVFKVVGPALHRHPVMAAQFIEVAAAASGNEDAVGTARLGNAAADEPWRHQCGDADADLLCLVHEIGGLQGIKNPVQLPFGKPSCQEEDFLRHSLLAMMAFSNAAMLSTTSVASKFLRRSTLSRSMRRG